MKILAFSFVLLVLTNKNLSLKNCVVFFFLIFNFFSFPLIAGWLHHSPKLPVFIYVWHLSMPKLEHYPFGDYQKNCLSMSLRRPLKWIPVTLQNLRHFKRFTLCYLRATLYHYFKTVKNSFVKSQVSVPFYVWNRLLLPSNIPEFKISYKEMKNSSHLRTFIQILASWIKSLSFVLFSYKRNVTCYHCKEDANVYNP